MRCVVVGGTGTGIGKTYVTRLLREALEPLGRPLALKPIESGYVDATCDARGIGGQRWVTPLYHFPEGLSPHLVARRSGTAIELPHVVDWVHEHARAQAADITLVETAGGLFTPLDDGGHSNADLVAALEPCRWVLVAPNRLGVLHDVAAVLRAMAERRPAAIILSNPISDASSPFNLEELRRLVGGGSPVLDASDSEALAEFAERLLDRSLP